MLLFIAHASAATEQIEATYRWSANASGATGFSSTAQQACDAFGPTHATNQNNAALPAHKTYTYTGLVTSVNNQTSLCQVKNASNVDGSFSVSRQWGCTPFTVWNSGNNEKYYCTVPVCVPPEVRQPDGSCGAPPPPECEPGCNGACGQQKTFNRLRTLACISQCIYRLGGGMEIELANGQSRAYMTVQENTGASCTPEQETVTPDPVPCPECACQDQGKSYAVMQGVAVCLEPGTPGSEPVKKQDPPKVETHTPAPTPENPNPEPVVTETPSPVITITPAPAGSPAGTAPTITETTTNADGSSTSTQQSQDAFCQANPTHKVCRQEDAKTDCDKYPDAIGCQVMGDVPEFEPLETKEIDMSSIVLRELPSDNSCPAPLTYTIGGHTITLSFDPICQYASAFKPLVIAAAWLSAAFIIVGARKDSI
ncbi:virulence factor TspB C-terminal domain-related protein [Methylobacillus methanolivorans]